MIIKKILQNKNKIPKQMTTINKQKKQFNELLVVERICMIFNNKICKLINDMKKKIDKNSEPSNNKLDVKKQKK